MTPAICIVGYSGSGKTTLIEKLIVLLRKKGYRIGTIKHSRHDIENDKPGKDSWRHKAAGAETVVLAGPGQINLVKKIEDSGPAEILPYMQDLDLVIIEGFKNSPYPKILVVPPESPAPQTIQTTMLAAMVGVGLESSDVPCFDRDNVQELATFIERRFLKSSSIPMDSERHLAADIND